MVMRCRLLLGFLSMLASPSRDTAPSCRGLGGGQKMETLLPERFGGIGENGAERGHP